MSKVFVLTLGCDKNRVDGEELIGRLRMAGFSVINQSEEAEAIIVNTCGFIKDAVRESIDTILDLAEYKKEGKCRCLIVTGCMATRYKDDIIKSIPETDLCIGVGEYDLLISELCKTLGTPKIQASEHKLPRMLARRDDIIPHIAYVKISDGCDNNCTYCTIPSIRGKMKSRTIEDITEECAELSKNGVVEFVLVAQDTASYGMDLYGEQKLPALLEALSGFGKWIRLMYVYPERITPKLISAFENTPNFCKYIDMPIQHCREEILQKMGRKGGKFELMQLVRVLRDRIPGINVRTTLMVGFPGETKEDFEDLYEFVKDVRFDRLGVFPYSQEDGTEAALMDNQTDEDVKEQRLAAIMELQQKIHFENQKILVGEILPVIIDFEKDNEYIGRTQGDAYDVDSLVFISSERKLKQGDIVNIKITEAINYDLRGIIHESAE